MVACLGGCLQGACAPLTSSETKDVETSVAGLRTDKSKAEQAEAAVSAGSTPGAWWRWRWWWWWWCAWGGRGAPASVATRRRRAPLQAKKGTKKQLNIGKTGASAGLDDYIYDDAGQGDDFGESW